MQESFPFLRKVVKKEQDLKDISQTTSTPRIGIKLESRVAAGRTDTALHSVWTKAVRTGLSCSSVAPCLTLPAPLNKYVCNCM